MLLEVTETLLYERQEGDMDYAEQLKKYGINLKFPQWKAERDQWEAEKARLLQVEKDKIFGLLEQGKPLEQVKAILARRYQVRRVSAGNGLSQRN